MYMGRNNAQNSTKTQITQNREQNIQNEATNIKRTIKKYKKIKFDLSN
jgi:rRNA processing protein Krr1/Pno1